MTQRDCDDCRYCELEGTEEPCKSCKATAEGFTNWKEREHPTMTNADRINAMTIEEKAEFLSSIAYGRETPWSKPFAEKFCKSCPTTTCTVEGYHHPLELHECDFSDGKCHHGSDIVWWLQQPAEGDGNA